MLDYVDPKFDVVSNGDGLEERRGFLMTNLLTLNVSGVVNSGSSTVQKECLTKSTQNLTKSRMVTVGMVKHCLTNNHVGMKFTGPRVRQNSEDYISDYFINTKAGVPLGHYRWTTGIMHRGTTLCWYYYSRGTSGVVWAMGSKCQSSV